MRLIITSPCLLMLTTELIIPRCVFKCCCVCKSTCSNTSNVIDRVVSTASSVLTAISRWIYQNVSILDFIGAKGDGGGGDN